MLPPVIKKIASTRTLLLLLLAMFPLSSCVTTTRSMPPPLAAPDWPAGVSGERFLGEMQDQSGMTTVAPVVVTDNRRLAVVQLEGEVLRLPWHEDSSSEACNCRFYRDQRFAVMVFFPGPGQVARATVLRLQLDPLQFADALLTDEDGLTLRIRLGYNGDRTRATFDYNGEQVVLTGDGRADPACDCHRFTGDGFTADLPVNPAVKAVIGISGEF